MCKWAKSEPELTSIRVHACIGIHDEECEYAMRQDAYTYMQVEDVIHRTGIWLSLHHNPLPSSCLFQKEWESKAGSWWFGRQNSCRLFRWRKQVNTYNYRSSLIPLTFFLMSFSLSLSCHLTTCIYLEIMRGRSKSEGKHGSSSKKRPCIH